MAKRETAKPSAAEWRLGRAVGDTDPSVMMTLTMTMPSKDISVDGSVHLLKMRSDTNTSSRRSQIDRKKTFHFL